MAAWKADNRCLYSRCRSSLTGVFIEKLRLRDCEEDRDTVNVLPDLALTYTLEVVISKTRDGQHPMSCNGNINDLTRSGIELDHEYFLLTTSTKTKYPVASKSIDLDDNTASWLQIGRLSPASG